MTGISIKTTVDSRVVRAGLENLQAEISAISRRRLYDLSNRIVTRMRKPVPSPSGKIKWVSDKQRRAFFASGGFGRGIPTKRGGGYSARFTIEAIDKGYVVSNSYPGAKYIGGDAYGQHQSPIHAGRWPLFRDVVDEEVKKLPEEVEKELNIVKRRLGF